MTASADEAYDAARRFEALGAVCHAARGGRQVLVPVAGAGARHLMAIDAVRPDSPFSRYSDIGKVLVADCAETPPRPSHGAAPADLFYDVHRQTGEVLWLGPALEPDDPSAGVVDCLQRRRRSDVPRYRLRPFGLEAPKRHGVVLAYLATDRAPWTLAEVLAVHGHGVLLRPLGAWAPTTFTVPRLNTAVAVGVTPAIGAQAPAGAGAAGTALAEAREACAALSDVQARLQGLEEALQDDSAPRARELLQALRHVAAEPAAAGGCRRTLQHLSAAVKARLCRQTAAAAARDARTRDVILHGDAAAATRALVAELEGAPLDAAAREAKACLHALAATPAEARAAAPTLERHGARHGHDLDPQLRAEAEQACAALPPEQAELVSDVLRTPAPPWRELRERIGDASAPAINCGRALAALEHSARLQSCRAVLGAALGPAAKAQTLPALAERVALEIRAGNAQLWQQPDVPRCLAAAAPDAAARLVRELGEPSAALQPPAGALEHDLRRGAHSAVHDAQNACKTVAAVPPGGGLEQLNRATDVPALAAAKVVVEAELAQVARQQEAEKRNQFGTHLAGQADALQGCRTAAEQALRSQELRICRPLLAAAAQVPATDAQPLTTEQLVRRVVAVSEDPNALHCARAVSPELANLLLLQKQASALPPLPSSEGLEARQAVCAAVAALGGPPLNPLNPVTLLGLAGLPGWSPSVVRWLNDAVGAGPRHLQAPNGAAVFALAAPGSLQTLRAAVRELLQHHPTFEGLATQPCEHGAGTYADAWKRLALSGTTGADANALLKDLTAAHAAMLEDALKAAQQPTRTLHGSIYQTLWEGFLRYALAHPTGALLRSAAHLKLPHWPGAAAADFLRLEALFMLVLFDSPWSARPQAAHGTWARLGNLLRTLGSSWPLRLTTTQAQDLASAAAVALAQSGAALQHPTAVESTDLYVNPTTRSLVWQEPQFREQLQQRRAGRFYLPAPRLFPLIPFGAA